MVEAETQLKDLSATLAYHIEICQKHSPLNIPGLKYARAIVDGQLSVITAVNQALRLKRPVSREDQPHGN